MIAAFVLAAAFTVPPRPTEYVTDNAGVLSSATVSNLDTELQNYENVTGHRVIVWIGQTTGDVPLENWTINAFENWKIGRKGKDDGAVLFLFTHDKKIRIEVGYGLEPVLTDAASFRIINDTIRPKMRAGDPDAAVQDGIDQILLTITPSFKNRIGHEVATPENSDDTRGIIIALCIFIFVMAFIIRMARRGRGGSAAGMWFLGSALGSGGWGDSGGGGFGGLSSGGFGGMGGGGGASGGW